ncbi:MAG: heparan-alpha-glucosaminide N-acetyltransferase [Rickettsia endosymbiont of Ixodes persulcatus]|nr:heparan-alpha-glucosaminide N-acetyltransferase [Rickettsia endosymbiont of Ixodes persulcatus]
MSQNAISNPPVKARLGKLDILRGIALIAMATYHTGWDFEFFGYLEPGTTGHGAWKLYARCIASTFLVLVGFSLVLAHKNGVRWRPFGIRIGQIIAGALAVTVITYQLTPDSFVFFGILHQIAAASLLGVIFLRLPAVILAIAAAAAIAAPHYLASSTFDVPWLWPLGLSEIPIRSNDFVPIFPWFGAVLAGMALAKTFQHFDWLKLFAGNIKPDWLDSGLRLMDRVPAPKVRKNSPIACPDIVSRAKAIQPSIRDTEPAVYTHRRGIRTISSGIDNVEISPSKDMQV